MVYLQNILNSALLLPNHILPNLFTRIHGPFLLQNLLNKPIPNKTLAPSQLASPTPTYNFLLIPQQRPTIPINAIHLNEAIRHKNTRNLIPKRLGDIHPTDDRDVY